MILQSANTEVLLMVISLLLTIIGGVVSLGLAIGRKYIRKILSEIENIGDKQDEHAKELEKHSTALFGDKNYNWDGAVNEIKKNQTQISDTHDRLHQHRNVLETNDLLNQSDMDGFDSSDYEVTD